MQDETIKLNILKCSRCGLCQGVCPVYEEIKNENAAARGKLMQIWGLIKGELKLNKKILKNLNLCLNCDKCKLNCPSGVNTTDVFNFEKKLGLIDKIMYSRFVFVTKMLTLRIFSLFKPSVSYEKKSNIVYFEGCIAKELKNGLKLNGIKLQKGNFECCGLPYLTKGRCDIYYDIMRRNEKIIEDAEFVVFDCATCFSAVKNYVFKNPDNKKKLIFYTDFLKQQHFLAKKPLKVSYHMPCHLKSAGIELKEIEEILSSIKNIKYCALNNPDYCCGFGGDFFLRHPKIALSLSYKKALDIMNTDADIILSSCPTCLWSLNFSLFVYKITHRFAKNPKVYDMADFINKKCTAYKNIDIEMEEKNLVQV